MSEAASERKVENAIRWDHPAAAHPVIIDAQRGQIDWRGRTKFALVGFASSSMGKAPYDDPSWIVCGLNQLYRHIPRADCWMDVHAYWAEEELMVDGTDHVGWCAAAPIPILMNDLDPRVPTAVRYPVERLAGLAPDSPPWAYDYFTSSISYGIAFAIDQGFKTIGLWGIDLIVGKEYFHQKACAEWWLGTANGLGVQIVLPEETALLFGRYRYGYETGPAFWPIKQATVEKRLKEYREEHQQALRTLYMTDGAIQALEGTLKNAPGDMGPEARAKIEGYVEEHRKTRDHEIKHLYTVDGAIQDCGHWLEFMDLKVRGGTVAGEGT